MRKNTIGKWVRSLFEIRPIFKQEKVLVIIIKWNDELLGGG